MDRRPDQSVTEALAEHGPATGPELAALLDVHPATVERWCRRLQREGRVLQVTGGAYALAGPGTLGARQASD